MKASETKTASSTHQPQHQDAQTPFFKKGGEGTFFSETTTNVISRKEAPPFFSPNNIQTKLKIGQPNDKYEVEADAVADRVVNQINSPKSTTTTPNNIQQKVNQDAPEELQKMEAEEEISKKEIEVQRKPIFESAEDPAENNIVQRKISGNGILMMQADSTGASASTSVESGLSSSGSGSPLPDDTRATMESGIGADFSGVRIHTDSQAVQMNNQLGAQAFTHGSDIYFNEGKYDNESTDGNRLLAHELTHTVQQGAAIQRKPKISSTSNNVQALFGAEGKIRGWIADKVNKWVPAYALLSVIIGYDLIRGKRVPRNRDNILKGVFSIVNPIGMILYQRLKENGIIGKAFEFISGQITTLGLSLGQLKQTFSNFWEETSVTKGISGNYELFKRYFGGFFGKIKKLVVGIKNKVFAMVKDAFLKILVKLAKAIGGYDLLADLLGYDPITKEKRKASTAKILRGILKLPIIQALGGDKLLAKLEEHKLIDKAAKWMDKQWIILKGAFVNMKNIGTRFLSLFSFETLRAPMKFINGIKNDVVGFVTKVYSFFKNIASTALKLIKEVLIWLLKKFVDENTLGYDLAAVILGKDPLTGKKVARTGKNLLKGFLGLLPGGKALFNRFEETGAIDKLIAWVMGAVVEFVQILGMVKNAFVNLWKASSITQLFEPIPFFLKIVNIFKKPFLKIVSFVKRVLTKIFEVLLQIMKFPGKMAKQIIQNIKAAFQSIKKDPIGFLMRMLDSVKQGFTMFFDNIGKHLLAGVSGWLFGQVAKAGLTPPKDMSMGSILGLVMDILGITVDKIWDKLAEKIGPEKVEKIKSGIDKVKGVWLFVKDVMQNGISAVWKFIQEKISNLWSIVVEEVKSWVITKVIQKVMTKLLSMLDPTGVMAVVNGFMAFFNAIQSFMEYFQKMLEIVNTFVGGMAEVAKGVISKAAKFLESGLSKALPVALGFLANQVGLSNIGDKLGEIIGAVREMVDKALTWLIDKAMKGIQGVMGLFGGGKKEDDKSKKEEKNDNIPSDGDIGEVIPFFNGNHKLWVSVNGKNIEIVSASLRAPVVSRLVEWEKKAKELENEEVKNKVLLLIRKGKSRLSETEIFAKNTLGYLEEGDSDIDKANVEDEKTEDSEKSLAEILEEIYELVELDDDKGGKIKLVEISFAPINNKYDRSEYFSQLKGQEKGINSLSVSEWKNNRNRYLIDKRAKEGDDAQSEYRGRIALELRELKEDQGMSAEDAAKWVEEYMDTQAALHDPDQIAGGNPTGIAQGDKISISGLGKRGINSSIGRKWRDNISQLDEHVNQESSQMNDEKKERILMNVKLNI